MAVDTVNEKLALLAYMQPWQSPAPISADGLGQDDKQQLLWEYPGILWGVAPVTPVTPDHLDAAVHWDLTADARAKPVGSGAKLLYGVSIDNADNTKPVYLKLYDAVGPTVGLTDPAVILKTPMLARRIHMMNNGTGRSFATALTVACTTTPGTAGTQSPRHAVPVTLKTN